MRAYLLTHLSDAVLLRDLATLVAQNRTTTTSLLAHIAEVDARKLYAPAGYPSMFAYCVEELHLSEDAAYKRIQAARAAREFPLLFDAVADGRLHLTAVRLLAPHLTGANVEELVAEATHLRASEVEALLAQRFPRPGMLGIAILSRVRQLGVGQPQLASGQVEDGDSAAGSSSQLASGQVEDGDSAASSPSQLAARQVRAPASRVAPLSAEEFSLQVTIDKETRDLLEYAQALLAHSLDGGVSEVLKRALRSLVGQIEKRKFAATSKPRRGRTSIRRRHISSPVRRAVWERDQAQCTFVGDNGRRCGTRRFLEFDHIDPVGRGGKATVEGMRLRCRTHNQYEAERTFGAAFMQRKREEEAQARDIMAGLRNLGVRADVARRAAEFAKTLENVTLEERMRAALRFLGPKTARVAVAPA